MPNQITSYSVFIASPSGLESERLEFRDVFGKHNEADALARKCMFLPVGWEMTLGGVGRPQEKINQELIECDYFVLLLWDRWGTPASTKGGYSSGAEEEFRIAMSCLNDRKHSMSEVVVFFKAVDARQLSDPGSQLQKVLNFKKELEESKAILFETFDTVESFGEKMRRHLSKWTRDHERKFLISDSLKYVPVASKTTLADDEIADDLITRDEPEDNAFVDSIEGIYKAGNLTEAEQKLVSEVVSKKSIRAYYSYGLFLLRSERLSDAENAFKEMKKIAIEQSDSSWAGTAESRLGGIYRAQGKYREAREALERALDFKQAADDDFSKLHLLVRLGDLHSSFRRFDKALAVYNLAIASPRLTDESLLADLRFKRAKCELALDNLESAIVDAEYARAIYVRLGNKKSLQAIKDWKKAKKVPLSEINLRKKVTKP